MKVSSAWIKNQLRRTMLNDTKIGDALARAGIEIEQEILLPPIDKMIITALVKKVVQHPGADRLKICSVEVGEREYQVVCGAPNVRAGMKVPFAQVGSTLPGGDVISEVKLRGELSQGMLCSARELGLGDDHDGLLELDQSVEIGVPMSALFPADVIFDVKTPANRFDVQSVYGLARDVAALTQSDVSPLPSLKANIQADPGVVEPDHAAKAYLITEMQVSPGAVAPTEMQARLRAVGGRPLGGVVDVTNFVLHELGQPLHAFDADTITLPLTVRPANVGETLVTLDDVERALSPDDLVVADAHGPVALAGIKGGKATEVTAQTKRIYLEAASFDAVRVRKTAQRLGLRTDASARFERSIPAELAEVGLARAISLLEECAGGKLLRVVGSVHEPSHKRTVHLSLARLERVLGFGVSAKDAQAALEGYGIRVELVGDSHKPVSKTHKIGESSKTDDALKVDVPWWRPDIVEPEDLVEEIVRVIGYDNVPSTIPAWRPKNIAFDHDRATRRRIVGALVGAGGFEVMTYSFVSAEQIERLGLAPEQHLALKNPLSSEQAYLRRELGASHLAVIAKNRKTHKTGMAFEISNVFLPRTKGDQPDEPLMLGVSLWRPDSALRSLKGVLDLIAQELQIELQYALSDEAGYAPGRRAEIRADGKVIGWYGQLAEPVVRSVKIQAEVAHAELNLGLLLKLAKPIQAEPLPEYPGTSRDIALVLPREVMWQDVSAALAQMKVGFVEDYFGKELPAGFKGMTIRVSLFYPDRTPTDNDAQKLEDQVVAILKKKFGARRRDS